MIHRWDVITIGNISRNRFWGESDDAPRRGAICTGTLIRGDGLCLLVDPPLGDRERMAAELDRRTGLRLEDVDAVFCTHAHGDHVAGLEHFERASWLAAPPVARALNEAGPCGRSVEPATGKIADAVQVLPTPGHTPDHHSLRLDCDRRCVVVTGDAAMTREFWQQRMGYFNSADFEQAARTIDELAGIADIVVPGHDNYFLNDRP